MKARGVSIFLTVLALSALTLFLVTLLDGEAQGSEPGDGRAMSAQPDTLLDYEETITVGPDGTTLVEVALVIGRGGSGDLLLPFEFDDGKDFTILSGPAFFGEDEAGVSLPTIMVLGQNMLNLWTPETAAMGDTVRVAATIPDWFRKEESRKPHGEYFLQRRYVNHSRFVMGVFRMNLVLPPGMVVHSIIKVVPDFDPKKNPQPPYSISRSEGLARVGVEVKNLAPASVAQLDINIRPSRRGWIPLIGGLIAVILYLIFYRDVLKPKETE